MLLILFQLFELPHRCKDEKDGYVYSLSIFSAFQLIPRFCFNEHVNTHAHRLSKKKNSELMLNVIEEQHSPSNSKNSYIIYKITMLKPIRELTS